MTKETAEKEYQRKFCEAKLDEYFELIQRDGPHIWENVQVAHVMCNSEKGDKVSV